MKKITLILAFISLISSFRAQTYLPFPDANATWVNTFYNQVPIGPTYQYVLYDVTNFCTDGDTIIGLNTYTRIEKCPENEFHAAIREDNGVVYVIPKDSTNEFVLYDFTVQPGDTIHNLYFEYFSGQGNVIETYVITSVQTITLDGIDRIVVDDMWYEGIGNRQGLFLEPLVNISQYMVKLECHSVNGLGIYPTATNEPCPLNLNTESINIELGLYPNPVVNKLTVKTDEQIESYSIVNQIGKEIVQAKAFSSIIDLSELKPGFYTIRFNSSKGTFNRTFYKN